MPKINFNAFLVIMFLFDKFYHEFNDWAFRMLDLVKRHDCCGSITCITVYGSVWEFQRLADL